MLRSSARKLRQVLWGDPGHHDQAFELLPQTTDGDDSDNESFLDAAEDGNKQQTARLDPFAYASSPFQPWLNGTMRITRDRGSFEPQQLPIFSKSSAYLLNLFKPYEHAGALAFLLQWDVLGLLLVSALFGVRLLILSQDCTLEIHRSSHERFGQVGLSAKYRSYIFAQH